MAPSSTSSPARELPSSSSPSSNGWDEHKRLVEYRLNKNEQQLEAMDEKLDDIVEKLTRLDERHSRAGAIAGAFTGFVAGLTGWLK